MQAAHEKFGVAAACGLSRGRKMACHRYPTRASSVSDPRQAPYQSDELNWPGPGSAVPLTEGRLNSHTNSVLYTQSNTWSPAPKRVLRGFLCEAE